MIKVKITVVRRFDLEDVFGHDHGLKGLSGDPITRCTLFEEGAEFTVDDIERMLDGFCGWAWRDIYKDL